MLMLFLAIFDDGLHDLHILIHITQGGDSRECSIVGFRALVQVHEMGVKMQIMTGGMGTYYLWLNPTKKNSNC